MNILLINHYAGSTDHGMEYRPFYMAREWLKMGYKVKIIGASYSHLRSKQPDIIGNVTHECIQGISYSWLRTPAYQSNGIGRVINMLFFIAQLIIFCGRILKGYKPDVVIASSTYPLDIYPAKYIANKYNAKLVYEVHDLWPLSPIELGGMSPRHPFIMVMQIAENYAYRVADKVISMLPKAKEHMCEHGMEAYKFTYVPNGIDVKEWESNNDNIPEQHKRILKQLKSSDNFIVGYAGSHGLANALQYFVEAGSLLCNEPIAFVLVGQGPEKEILQKKVCELNISNVYFLPAIPKSAVPELLSLMDILYIGWNRLPIYRFGICPNKLFDYMMAAKPVIHAVEAGNDLVAESDCGISIPPESPVAIAKAIAELKKMTSHEREKIGLNGRQYVIKNHDYKILARKFIEFLHT